MSLKTPVVCVSIRSVGVSSGMVGRIISASAGGWRLHRPGVRLSWRVGPVTEVEEHRQLRPGLGFLAGCIVRALAHLGHGQPVCGLSRHKLTDNPAWPPELAERTKAGGLPHERYVTLMPLALSRTLDDK